MASPIDARTISPINPFLQGALEQRGIAFDHSVTANFSPEVDQQLLTILNMTDNERVFHAGNWHEIRQLVIDHGGSNHLIAGIIQSEAISHIGTMVNAASYKSSKEVLEIPGGPDQMQLAVDEYLSLAGIALEKAIGFQKSGDPKYLTDYFDIMIAKANEGKAKLSPDSTEYTSLKKYIDRDIVNYNKLRGIVSVE